MQHIEPRLLGISLDDLTAVHAAPIQQQIHKKRLWYLGNVVTLAALAGAIYLLMFNSGTYVSAIADLIGVEVTAVGAFMLARYIALALIGGIAASFYLRFRRRLSQSHNWSNICATCGPATLKRVHRTRGQRLFASFMRLPLRHFVCNDCGWHGTRVDIARL